jgi:thiol-disulfide isomerase/thioredoxin
MSRMKPVCFVCLLMGALTLAALPASAQETDAAALEERIQALEAKVSALEKNLYQRLSTLERQVKQGAQAPNPLEGEAQQAYGEINRLVAESKFDEAKAAMAEFMKKYSGTATAKRAGRLNQELAVIGKTAPTEWSIEKWYQGESEIDLAGDKTTLLVFWEVWCPHCQREVPKMQAFYDELKDEGLQVVGLTRITKSATEEKVTTFIEENDVKYPLAKESGAISQYFNVSGIPAAAVVKDGKVIWRGHPARLSQDTLKGWL